MIEIASGTTLSVEHGWLCIRNETGWLLWSEKIDKIPARGLFLADIVAEANRNALVDGSLPANPRPEPAPSKRAHSV